MLSAVVAGEAETVRSQVVELSLMRRGIRDTAQAPADVGAKIEEAVAAQLPGLMSGWLKSYLMQDPQESLGRIKCPVLAINGTKDMQMYAAQNLHEIERQLSEGGNTDTTLKEIEGLNHLFQPVEPGLPNEDAIIETTMSQDVMTGVAEWVHKWFAPR